MSVKPAFVGRTMGNVVAIDPRAIEVLAQYNVRDAFDPENDPEDAELLALIKRGYDNNSPLLVAAGANGKPYLIRGHRRLAAVMTLIKAGAKIATVPATLEEKGTTDTQHQVDLVQSNTGKKLSLGEIGTVCQRLISYGNKAGEVAKMFGYSERHVHSAIEASNADPRLKKLIKAKKISVTLAQQLVAAHGEQAAITVVETALSSGAVAQDGAKAGQVTVATLAPAEQAVTGSAKVAGRKAPAKDAAPAAPATPPRNAPAKREGTNGTTNGAGLDVAVLDGPFLVGTGSESAEIWDRSKAGIAWAESPALARALVDLLNAAWHAGMYKPNGKTVAKPVIVAPGGTPVATQPTAPMKAAAQTTRRAPAKRTARGK